MRAILLEYDMTRSSTPVDYFFNKHSLLRHKTTTLENRRETQVKKFKKETIRATQIRNTKVQKTKRTDTSPPKKKPNNSLQAESTINKTYFPKISPLFPALFLAIV